MHSPTVKRGTTMRLLLIALLVLSRCAYAQPPDSVRSTVEPLSKGNFYEFSDVDLDSTLWAQRAELLVGVENNLRLLETDDLQESYKEFSKLGISKDRVEQSLRRFRDLLSASTSRVEVLSALKKEFVLFRPQVSSQAAPVKFTGYFQPTYHASRQRTKTYQYPIYQAPFDFDTWPQPHPTRIDLEGYDGKGNPNSLLRGSELFWFKSRFEVFMVQLQGSAVLDLTDGSRTAVGFGAGTDYRFRGIPKEYLIEHKISWQNLDKYFNRSPEQLDYLMSLNNRFVMFEEKSEPTPMGSLGVPVIAERSIATDKLHLPPAALGIIQASLPVPRPTGGYQLIPSARLVLDQDTGSAIKGPMRVDVFMGTGPEAGRKASTIATQGQLYYVLLKRWNKGNWSL